MAVAGGRSSRGGDEDSDEAQDDPESVARIICLQLLTDRSRTRSELAAVLRRRGVPDAAAATALDRLGAVGLVDDAAFAEAWVHSRHTARGLGRRALAAELRRRGVADDLAGEALASVDDAAEEQRANELVRRRLRSIPVDAPQDAAARRLLGMLSRKGYPPGLAYRVVRAALQERGLELVELNDAGLDTAELAGD